jgi:hypothetical protein
LLRTREFQELKQAVGDVKERMAQRRRFLEQQLAQPEPVPLALEGGVAQFGDWQTSATSVGGTLDRSPAPDGRKSLHISASARTSASWRTKVLLPKGPYRFEAMAFTKAVKALDFGRNQGAGLRVVGATPRAPYRLVGDQSWTKLEQRFTLEAEQEVELVCELRAAGGEVWFALDSLRLSLTERPLRQ